MLGDTAVMVHPDDERYTALHRQAGAAAAGRAAAFPVIADDYVDREFGTGVVKVTPAHDANDYAVGQRHGLPMIGILALDATRQRQRARGLPRARPLRRAQARGRRPRGAGPARRGEEAQADGAALRAHRAGRRADADRPVVRRRHQARARRQERGAEGDRRGEFGPGEVRARTVGQHLRPVDEEHPGLVHLAPALVGPPDPGLVRQRRRGLRRPQRGRGARQGAGRRLRGRARRATRTCSTPGTRRRWCRSRRSAGRARRRSSRPSCRRACSSPATRSSSSGSPG